MKKTNTFLTKYILISILSVLLGSCSSLKDAKYFRNLNDSTKVMAMLTPAFKDPLIQAEDILSITITTVDPLTSVEASQVSPAAIAAPSTSYSAPQAIVGFLVDKNGFVSLPIIGDIKVAGMTTFEARALIAKAASKFFKSPNVQIRFANFQVTVLGEVNHPATFTSPSERISVLDALGLAGDLTIYGKRDNVLLIREDTLGNKQFIRFNLNSSNIFMSPFFYLKQNDVIYVEPNRNKIIETDAARTRTLTIVASLLAGAIVVFSRVKL